VDLAGRVLPFDSAAAREFADIAASRRRAGQPTSEADARIAAIARSRGARSRGVALATRNVGDFAGGRLELIDP
jgi:toxin FitB